MKSTLLFDADGLDIANGLYVALSSDGTVLGQSNTPGEVLALARAKGTATPIVVNLDLTQDKTYVF